MLNRLDFSLIGSMCLFSERYIMIIETIHNILFVLTDDHNQINSTSIKSLEQSGQSSRMLIEMIEINNEDNFDLVRKIIFDFEDKKC